MTRKQAITGLVVAVFIGAVVGAGFLIYRHLYVGNAGGPNQDDLERLQGKWRIITYIEDGKPKDWNHVWTIAGNKVIYVPDASVYSIIKLEASKKPKTIDFDTVIKNPAKTNEGLRGPQRYLRIRWRRGQVLYSQIG